VVDFWWVNGASLLGLSNTISRYVWGKVQGSAYEVDTPENVNRYTTSIAYFGEKHNPMRDIVAL
jgi:hypothetical protein